MRKSVILGVLTMAAAGSLAFGGSALAGGWGGGDGVGGTATNNCLNIAALNLLDGVGIAGQGSANVATCTATANGTGGDAS